MKKLLIGLIRLYQRAISANTPPTCRFTPTCSAYALGSGRSEARASRYGVFYVAIPGAGTATTRCPKKSRGGGKPGCGGRRKLLPIPPMNR